MADLVFVKAEPEPMDVKEECFEKDDPLSINSAALTGY